VKSINVKRMAAVAFGAALLGATLLAAAPVMYGNTEIINAQGKPVVKVVVGSGGLASDAVAAGNIAAVIGNLAFKSQTVTAQLSGSPTCSVSGAGAAGTCTVSDRKAELEITTPGTSIAAGAFGFRTYMFGFFDNNQTNEDNQVADGTPKEIKGDNFASFADSKSTVSSTSGSFTSKQKLFLKSVQAAAWFEDVKKYKVVPSVLFYTLSFEHDTWGGIPACTLNSAMTSTATNATLAANCIPADTYLMSRQRLKINYLGEDWIISEMNPDASPTSIKIAKESTPAQIVYVGQNLSAGVYTLRLSDITIPFGTTDSQAVVQIYDANNNLVKDDTITQSTSKALTLPNGDKITIRVFKIAAGLTLTKWAEMSVFSQELELTQGLVVDSDENKNWTVSLGWKNYSTGVNDWVLANLTLTRTSLDRFAEGEAINILELPQLYQLQFDGQTLTDAQRDTLKIDYTRISSFFDSETATSSISDSLNDYVCFTSDKKAWSFEATPASSDDRFKVCTGLGNSTPLLYEKPDKGMIRYVPTTTGNTVFRVGTTGTLAGNASVLVYDGTTWSNYSQGVTGTDDPANNLTLTANWTGSPGSWGSPASDLAYNFKFGNASTNNDLLYTVAASNQSNLSALVGFYAINSTMALSGHVNVLLLINSSLYMPNTIPFPFDLNWTTLNYNVQENTAENGLLYTTDSTSTNGTEGNTTVAISEYINKGGSSTQSGLAVTPRNISFIADPSSATFKASVSDTSESKLRAQYLTESGSLNEKSWDVGYTSQRGSIIEARASSSITLKMAKKLGEFQFSLKSPGVNATSGVSTITLSEGGQVTVQDSVVKLTSISMTVGACTVAGGNASCTADTGTMKAVLDTGAESMEVLVPYKLSATDRLVYLDSDAPTNEKLILVGGQFVNTLTAEALTGSDVQIDKPGVRVVTVIGNNIVVAGYTADDTQAAAAQFISELLESA